MENGKEITTTAPAGSLTKQDAGLSIAARPLVFEELSAEEQAAAVNYVRGHRLARELDRQADLALIDYQAERQTFLDQAGRTKSAHTFRAYSAALARLDQWAAFKKLPPLEMKPRDADDYAYALATDGRAPASVRRDIAAASSFFTFLERRHDTIRNPFRGSKARPEKRGNSVAAYPDRKEVHAIMAAVEPAIRAAIACMAFRGFRVGALPALAIRGSRFTTRSKGKDLAGELPREAMDAIKAAGLDLGQPFADLSAKDISNRLYYVIGKLAAAGRVRARYSPHDLRHFYAMTQYEKDHDIYRLKELLGHASIAVTESYLKGLGAL
jgi:site-specific recombinase XerD